MLIEDKNALVSKGITVVLLEINIPGADDILRVCSNNENIEWNGETWYALDFTFDPIPQTSSGEVPQWKVYIANYNGRISRYALQYDTYLKTNGINDSTIITARIYAVNTNDLTNTTPMINEYFELDNISSDLKAVSFTMKGAALWKKLFPAIKALKNYCPWKLGGEECGYSGEATICLKTLKYCETLGNTAYFGGEPGLGNAGVTFA